MWEFFFNLLYKFLFASVSKLQIRKRWAVLPVWQRCLSFVDEELLEKVSFDVGAEVDRGYFADNAVVMFLGLHFFICYIVYTE